MPTNSSTSSIGDRIRRFLRLGMLNLRLVLGFGGGCIRRDSLISGIRDGNIRSRSGEGGDLIVVWI